jgi:hypothetical protein
LIGRATAHIVIAMNRIDIRAVVLAFIAEICADLIVLRILFMIFGRGLLAPDMSESEIQTAVDTITAKGDFQFAAFVCGMSTTVLGGYFAARLAQGFPYYNGLAIGVVGVVFSLAFAGGNPLWLTIAAVLLTIPASIYGAHLARKRLAAPADQSR